MEHMHAKVVNWLNWAAEERENLRLASNAGARKYYLIQARECIKLARDYRLNCAKCLP